MPRKPKGPRLHWRKRKDFGSVWEIRDDGDVRISTGTDDRQQAEAQLSEYIARKLRPSGPLPPTEMSVSMCLSIYGEEHAIHASAPERIGYAIDALDEFWRHLPVSDVKGETCRNYAKSRKRKRDNQPATAGTVRRELNVLQAAINHCHREGYLTLAPKVTMPGRPAARERWLTRQEAAWLLRAARSLNIDGQHLADFILCSVYTGSRKATVLALHIDMPSLSGGHIDTTSGILYRRAQGKVETNKRQTPARLPRRYLAHIKRQAKNGRAYVVQDYKGRRVGDIRKGFSRAVAMAPELAKKHGVDLDLTGVTPHVLKHTAITWALQRGASIWDAAGYFGTSVETIQSVYGHHSPDWQASAVEAMDKR